MSTSANSFWVALGMGSAICMHRGVVLVVQCCGACDWAGLSSARGVCDALRLLSYRAALLLLHGCMLRERRRVKPSWFLLHATGQRKWKDKRMVRGVVTLGAFAGQVKAGPARVRLKRGVLRAELMTRRTLRASWQRFEPRVTHSLSFLHG